MSKNEHNDRLEMRYMQLYQDAHKHVTKNTNYQNKHSIRPITEELVIIETTTRDPETNKPTYLVMYHGRMAKYRTSYLLDAYLLACACLYQNEGFYPYLKEWLSPHITNVYTQQHNEALQPQNATELSHDIRTVVNIIRQHNAHDKINYVLPTERLWKKTIVRVGGYYHLILDKQLKQDTYITLADAMLAFVLSYVDEDARRQINTDVMKRLLQTPPQTYDMSVYDATSDIMRHRREQQLVDIIIDEQQRIDKGLRTPEAQQAIITKQQHRIHELETLLQHAQQN